MRTKTNQAREDRSIVPFVVSFDSSWRVLWIFLIGLLGFWSARVSAQPQQQDAGSARQNPSPMIEHTRAHARLTQESPPGRRESLEIGTLFLPENLPKTERVPLVVHFHGATWLPEVAAARHGQTAMMAIQLGSGSAAYAKPFADRERFGKLLAEAETKAGTRFEPITLSAWSAGYGALREILAVREYYDRVDRVLLIDALHAGYASGKPGPLESELESDKLDAFLKFANDAVRGKKRMLITHTEIFPGTFASTTETADWLIRQLELRRRAVLKWGPMGTQQLSELSAGRFHVLGYAGNSAPDHVDQLHALPDFLRLLD